MYTKEDCGHAERGTVCADCLAQRAAWENDPSDDWDDPSESESDAPDELTRDEIVEAGIARLPK